MNFFTGTSEVYRGTDFRCVAREHAVTEDGVILGIKRYPCAGGIPLLFLHGAAQNANGWDCPYRELGMGRIFSDLGFDVWMANFRNHGRFPFRSESGRYSPSLDDYAFYDLPALVEKITGKTGMKPFIIGQSMGGVSALMYLTGGVLKREPVGLKKPGKYNLGRLLSGGRIRLSPGNACPVRLEMDLEEARKRNSGIRGVALLATPPISRWAISRRIDLKPGTLMNSGMKFFFGLLRNPVAKGVLERIRRFPTGSSLLFEKTDSVIPQLSNIICFMGLTPLSRELWHPRNMVMELVRHELMETLEDTPVRTAYQFAEWARRKECHSYYRLKQSKKTIAFARYLDRVTAPLYFITGNHDPWAAPEAVRESDYTAAGSEDKTFIRLKGFGHNDLRLSPRAALEVAPLISEWIEERTECSKSIA